MITLLLLAVLGAAPQASAWSAPPSPDPDAILQEARADTRAGRHEVALTKFLWFHDNAVKYNAGLFAVRLSFALGYWSQLAKVYPPALEALKGTRDEALARVRRHPEVDTVFEPFSDFAAINRQLDEQSLTARAFVELDQRHPEAAARLFVVARPALIRAQEYRLCGKYLRPEEDWQFVARLYELNRQYESARSDPRPTAEKSFTNASATLVALLVVNGRRDEAEAIAQKARVESEDPAFRAALDAALRGAVPEPWP